jgi:hypothetical protein
MRRALVLLILASGCDAQVSASYGGEPVARFEATAIDRLSRPVSSGEAALAWIAQDTAAVQVLVPSLRLFDATRFALEIRDPPPASAMIDCDARFAVALVAIARTGALDGTLEPWSSLADMRAAGDVLGLSSGEVLVYVETPVASGSRAARVLGGSLAAGVHLMTLGGGSLVLAADQSNITLTLSDDAAALESTNIASAGCDGVILEAKPVAL